jgi:hypothetical protein
MAPEQITDDLSVEYAYQHTSDADERLLHALDLVLQLVLEDLANHPTASRQAPTQDSRQ